MTGPEGPVPSDSELDLIVEGVCRIPIDCVQLRTRSAVEVARRSGFGRRGDEVTVERIRRCLSGHPDWVDAWFHWSEDSRATPSWYLVEEAGEYEVGHFGSGGRSSQVRFADRLEACATYVRHQLEGIARLL